MSWGCSSVGERLFGVEEVEGSNPSSSTTAAGRRRPLSEVIHGAMETPVYDSAARWFEFLSVVLFAAVPAIALLIWLGLKRPDMALTLSGFFANVYTPIFLYFYFSKDVWIRVVPTDRKAFRFYRVFGWRVFQRAYDLSQFDRIILYHHGLFCFAVMAGPGREVFYHAVMLAPRPAVLVAKSRTRDSIRQKVEQIGVLSGLTVIDRL